MPQTKKRTRVSTRSTGTANATTRNNAVKRRKTDEPLSEKDIPAIVKVVLEVLPVQSSNQSSTRREEEGTRLPVSEGDTAVDTGGEYAMRALLAVSSFFPSSMTCFRTCWCCTCLCGCVGGVHLYIQSLAACMLCA